MGYQSIVHGRILLDGDFKKSQDFIKSLGKDTYYPKLSSEMFGLGIAENSYYEDPVIVFGATYKQVEYDWVSFILKFETILRNVSFDTAKIQLETEVLGHYNFFWKSKKNNASFDSNQYLIQTDEWYFGYGNRGRWGLLNTELEDFQIFTIENFKYPIQFTKEHRQAFHNLIEQIDTQKKNQKLYPFVEKTFSRDVYELIFPILSVLSFEKKIDFGFETIEDNMGNIISNDFYIKVPENIEKEALINNRYLT